MAPALITLDQYEQIPDPPGGRYGLQHGELAFVEIVPAHLRVSDIFA